MKLINKITLVLILLVGLVFVITSTNSKTPEIKIVEEETSTGKIITISAPDELDYENIKANIELEQEVPADRIRLYHKTEAGKIEVDVKKHDRNNNGLIDYIEWVVPHLSEQTYELVIVITKAEHLDENRKFISDIYKEVKELDNVWSEPINNNEYVRVTFEKKLTSRNDITIYPRATGGNPRIEVYEKDGNEIIASFDNLIDNEYNKVFLTNLKGEQDTFDLRVVSGSVEIEHIIDPTTKVVYYLRGRGGSGAGFVDNLNTTRGTASTLWVGSASGQTVLFVSDPYAQQTTLPVQSFNTTVWCNRTDTAGGTQLKLSQYRILDCSDASCSSPTQIATSGALSLDCYVANPTPVYSEAASIASSYVMSAGNRIGVEYTYTTNKPVHAVFSYNSTTYPSYVNVTETVVTDTCTYGGSGNWDLDCADNCVFTTTQTIGGFENVTITGTGTLTFNSGGKWSFTGSKQYVTIASGCTLNINTGGGWDY